MAAVIAEFFVSLQDGVGMFVLFNARNFNHDVAVVGVVALVAFGLMFEITMNWVTPPPVLPLVPTRNQGRLTH